MLPAEQSSRSLASNGMSIKVILEVFNDGSFDSEVAKNISIGNTLCREGDLA